MSLVHMFVIKDDNVYLLSVPYRAARNVLECGIDGVLPLLNSRFLDAGYLVVDFNRKTIINAQSAFHVSKSIKDKGFDVVEP